jgi:hypothetical protein
VLEYLNETDGIERLLREKSLQWPAVNVNVQVRARITRHGFVRLNARYLQANAPDACGDEAGRGAAGEEVVVGVDFLDMGCAISDTYL